MSQQRFIRSQRGDSLIEVTIALAILAFVLTGAFAIANKAFNIGQSAKERSQMVGVAQQQAEALQSFRDSHTWAEFVAGGGGGLTGINVRAITAGCTQPCFHMVLQTVGGKDQWIPASGPGNDSAAGSTDILGGQGYVRILASPIAAAPPTPAAYDFTIEYGIPARGGGPNLASSLRLRLTNLDALRP